ncbi:MAG: hypothetical protein WCG81_07265 [Candidatus Angelobacter sp.]
MTDRRDLLMESGDWVSMIYPGSPIGDGFQEEHYEADKTNADADPADGPHETTRLIDVNGFINVEQGEQQTKHSGTQSVFVVR